MKPVSIFLPCLNMSIPKIFISFWAISIITASCTYRSDIQDYANPEIMSAFAEVGDSDIVLTSKVSGSGGIKECGFYFGEDKDNMTMYQSELSADDAFSLLLRNVPRGKTYYFRSFISGGEDTRMSGTQAIDFSYKAPLVCIGSLTTYGASGVEYEFSVKDDLSGDLVCCGMCFNTSGFPDIRSERTTIDGGSYGTYKSSIWGYEPGETYYFRAYAITSNGVHYSDEVKFTFSVTFLSDIFEKYMYDNWDENSDGVLSADECFKVTKIDITSDNVSSLKGVEAFKNLDTLICRGISCGSVGGSGSLSENTILIENPYISYIDLSNNRLSSYDDMSTLERLRYLNLSGNALESFSLYNTKPSLTELDLSNNCLMGYFDSNHKALESLNLNGCTKLGFLRLNGCTKLGFLRANDSSIKFLDLSGLPELVSLDVNDSQKLVELKGLDLCSKLEGLKCDNCAIEVLDVSGLRSLEILQCDSPSLKRLYLTKNQKDNLVLRVGEHTEIICVD